ncbi:hypothetical protein OH77DRAFT_1526131 [Trametes cingulata]|nr:hypothetical protein OH77DRAFT_1526131 [Trametes cingulata]
MFLFLIATYHRISLTVAPALYARRSVETRCRVGTTTTEPDRDLGSNILLGRTITADPDSSEEHRTSQSAWTWEVLREVKDALERVECSTITWRGLWDLVELLEKLVEVHTLARLLVRPDFVIAWRNFIDRMNSLPCWNDHHRDDFRRCESALKKLESKLQSDSPAPFATESHPLTWCSGPASASQSPPSEPAQEQREGSPGTANPSDPDDTREPTSSSVPSLSKPLAESVAPDTTARQSPPPSGQDEREDGLSRNPNTLSGVSLPPPGPAASASASQTPPWHHPQDEADGCAATRSDPIEPRDDPTRGSASARPSSPRA